MWPWQDEEDYTHYTVLDPTGDLHYSSRSKSLFPSIDELVLVEEEPRPFGDLMLATEFLGWSEEAADAVAERSAEQAASAARAFDAGVS